MIKLFGWEKKMSDNLKEKREEELTWLWKDKVRLPSRFTKLASKLIINADD